jgi:hypothetical protein
MKRRNKSRFTRTDVDRICEMQRTIDAYKIVISDILLLINGKKVYRLISDVPQDNEIEIKLIYEKLLKRLEHGTEDNTK